jgi:GH25 family lysozyme M1 (1,4-beta-N-acetylmuramidase)
MAWLCETGRVGTAMGHPVAVAPRAISRLETGDTIILDVGNPKRTHTCVVIEQCSNVLVTADYGQHPLRGQKPSDIACRVVKRKLSVRGNKLWAGDRPIDSWLPLESELAWQRAQGTLQEAMSLDSWLARYEIVGGGEVAADASWIPGIDVSDLQSPSRLDYAAAYSAGYRWLVAKLSDGRDIDSRGAEHIRNARRAGMVPGGYHFFIPWRTPREQLEAMLGAADAADYGHHGDLIPWLDIESWRGASGQYRQAEPSWSAYSEELAGLISEHFGGCIVYLNESDYALLGKPDWIRRYPLAAAHYGVPAGSPRTAGGMQWAIHQHTVAPIPGVYSAPVDQSIARSPLPLIGSECPEPTRIDPAEIEVTQLRFDPAEHWAYRDQVIRQKTEDGSFD